MAATAEMTSNASSEMTPLWATYAALHSADYRALSIREGEEIIGGQAAADALAVQMKSMIGHTPKMALTEIARPRT